MNVPDTFITAFGFAKKDNWSFQKILKYYFKGVQLVKAY